MNVLPSQYGFPESQFIPDAIPNYSAMLILVGSLHIRMETRLVTCIFGDPLLRSSAVFILALVLLYLLLTSSKLVFLLFVCRVSIHYPILFKPEARGTISHRNGYHYRGLLVVLELN